MKIKSGPSSTIIRPVRPNNCLIRFVVGDRSDDPFELDGIITVAALMRKQKRFTPQEEFIVKNTFRWYNDNIPCPPFKDNKKKWGKNAICWWKITAREPINKLRPLIAVLRRERIVRTIYSRCPGNIVYEDQYQIVAQVWK